MTWKFKQIKPQKARGVLKPEIWTDPDWVAEVKYDGDRRIAQFCGDDAQTVRFTGTRESVDGTGYVEKTTNLPHLNGGPWSGTMTATEILTGKRRFAASKLDGTVLDGEIIAGYARNLPGGKSKYVTSIMGSDPARAIELQKKYGWLEYVVFDCLWFKGQDIRDRALGYRRGLMLDVLSQWKNKYATQTIQIVGNKKERFFHGLIRQGEEGVVLKHKDHTYGNEKLWVKVKGVWTADVVVLGFEPGKGKYTGSVGAILFGQYRKRGALLEMDGMGSCRGFTDLLMNSFTQNPKRYIGRVMEITHNGREPTGAFRHPRYKRFRDDKKPGDCVYDPEET